MAPFFVFDLLRSIRLLESLVDAPHKSGRSTSALEWMYFMKNSVNDQARLESKSFVSGFAAKSLLRSGPSRRIANVFRSRRSRAKKEPKNASRLR
jgi:hypothetical protein